MSTVDAWDKASKVTNAELHYLITHLEGRVKDLERGHKAPDVKARHAQTAHAMEKHAPPLKDGELYEYGTWLVPKKVYRAPTLAADFEVSRKEAQRILFWLSHYNFVHYDETKGGYISEEVVP